MKKIMLITVLPLMIFTTAFSQNTATQNPAFVKAMESQLQVLDTTQAVAGYQALANSFERIALAEKKSWQPFYFASFCYAAMAVQEKDKGKMEELAGRAESLLGKAAALSTNNSEILTLQAMITNIQILVDPMSRWRSYSQDAALLLQKAREANPANPRAYYIEARAVLQTPESLGGGAGPALPLLEEAIGKYKTFKPDSTIDPDWGKTAAEKLYTQLKSR